MAVAANRGTGGSVLDAQYGSSLTSNTNEPLLLTHTGTNYLYTSGVSGNFASTPHSSALDITGDIDIRVRVALDNWTPSSGTPTLMSKGYVHCWLFYLNGSTNISFAPTLSGGTEFTGVTWSSRPANGTAIWLRVTRVASTGVITFFSAADSSTVPSSWTTIGTTTSTAGNLLSDPAKYVGIGAGVQIPATSFEPIAGKFYRAQILNGISGTVALDADFTTGITSGGQTTITESSSNAATVTINRSTSGRKSVAVVRPVWLLGTDDYFEVADNDLLDFAASDSFTVVAVVRQWETPLNSGRYLSKGSGGTANAYILMCTSTTQGSTFRLDGTTGATYPITSVSTAGAVRVFAGVRDVATNTVTAYRNGIAGTPVADATTGGFANSTAFRIGRDGGGIYQDFECLAVAVFRRALTATEIASIATFYGAV
jgi:hypothetical protein